MYHRSAGSVESGRREQVFVTVSDEFAADSSADWVRGDGATEPRSDLRRNAHGLFTTVTYLYTAAGLDLQIIIRPLYVDLLRLDSSRLRRFMQFLRHTISKSAGHGTHSAYRNLIRDHESKLKRRMSVDFDTTDLLPIWSPAGSLQSWRSIPDTEWVDSTYVESAAHSELTATASRFEPLNGLPSLQLCDFYFANRGLHSMDDTGNSVLSSGIFRSTLISPEPVAFAIY